MTLGLFIRDAGNVAREISELVIRDASNTPRTISELWIRDTNNTPRLVFNPSGSASLAASPSPVTVSGSTSGSGTVSTDTTTATATGGTPPYTYAWTLVSYSSGTPPTATSPTGVTTAFTQTSLDPGAVETAEWKVTVTDDDGNTADGDSNVTSIFIDTSS